MIGLVLCIISFLGVLILIPESPKWLYSKQRFSECQGVLRYTAKFNGVKIKSSLVAQ